MSELPMSAEDRLAALERKVSMMWNGGGDLLGTDGYLTFGKFRNVLLSADGIQLVSSTNVNDTTQTDRYIQWIDDKNINTVLSKLGAFYSANLLSTTGHWWTNGNGLKASVSIGSTSNLDAPVDNAELHLALTDAFGSGVSGLFFYARNDASSTIRQLLEISPHGSVFSGRVKIGYDAASTDDIIALVLDNADTTSDLPTAVANLRGGLALVEGSPDKLYVCRSPDGGSSYEWVELGGGAMKTSGGGYYLIPAGPAAGTTAASAASANTYGSWTELRAASGSALYIVGLTVGIVTSAGLDYVQIDIGTGSAAAESSVGEVKIACPNDGSPETWYFTFAYPIPVGASTRIACRTADDQSSSLNHSITLHVIDQVDLVSL